jgi:DNA-binding transcriptional ArsR family regulator
MDSEALVIDALAQLGDTSPAGRRRIRSQDRLGGRASRDSGVGQAPRASDGDVPGRLLVEMPWSPDSVVLLLVGVRVTETARKLLIGHHAGYFDLRGHLALRSDGIVIDADVEPVSGHVERKNALSGIAGLEAATALLMAPAAGAAVRELAHALGRSASTVSQVLAALRGDGLVDQQHRVDGVVLAGRGSLACSRVYLTRAPLPGSDSTITGPSRLELDNAESTSGWVLTDSAAAVVYGVPLGVRADRLLKFYVPDQVTARRAVALLGTVTGALRGTGGSGSRGLQSSGRPCDQPVRVATRTSPLRRTGPGPGHWSRTRDS